MQGSPDESGLPAGEAALRPYSKRVAEGVVQGKGSPLAGWWHPDSIGVHCTGCKPAGQVENLSYHLFG